MPKKFDPEVKVRAVRMVLDRLEEAGSITKAVALVAPRVEVVRRRCAVGVGASGRCRVEGRSDQ